MGSKTGIQWTDSTWNPTTGCDRISSGCDNCYALTLAARLKAIGSPRYQVDGRPPTSGPGFGVTIHSDVLEQPLRWSKPRMVFVNSMSDLFHAKVPADFIAQVFATMALSPRHTFQVLTKRPERMAVLNTGEFRHAVAAHATRIISSNGRRRFDLIGWTSLPGDRPPWWLPPWPLANVWLGVSVENNATARRVAELRQVEATTRFVSAEPLLGDLSGLDLAGIDWLIIGGESGPNARPLEAEWIDDLVRRSATACGPAVFVKQLGSAWARDTYVKGRSVSAQGDPKGANWDHWPAHLKLRNYPPGRGA